MNPEIQTGNRPVCQRRNSMIQTENIHVRDPFILLENGSYYLYATTSDTEMSYYTSTDLEHWEPGGVAFEIPRDFWAYKDVWASEVHRYRGKYYQFVSLLGHNGRRGTQICVSDGPEGPFLPLKDHAVTPAEQSCIDGTLYVENGRPFIVYSHDWPDHYVEEKGAYVGEICACELTEDLLSLKDEPWVLFESDDVPLSKATPHYMEWDGKPIIRYGSDGPFLHRFPDGTLVLIWSPYLQNNYVVLGAVSESGTIKGPWRHMEKPVYDRDGGHAMLFFNKSGNLMISLHSPERFGDERARFLPVKFENGQLTAITEDEQ